MDLSEIDFDALLDAAIPKREPLRLFDPIRYTLSQGGKRIRPKLVLMACDLWGGSVQQAIKPAVGVEMFHNFTLIHDDIMDQAPLRRGKPTVYQKWDPNTAILSGDALFALAYQQLVDCDTDILPELLQAFNRLAIGVCEGQQLDLDFEQRHDVSLDEYINMIRLKTSVLLGGALTMGAILARAPKSDSDLLYEFGELIGIAFQLKDDLLDTYHQGDDFGKVVGGDIEVNKKTFLYLSALERANEEQKSLLRHYYSCTDFPREEKFKAVVSIFDALEIRKHTEATMDHFYQRALSAFDQIQVDDSRKKPLRAFAESLKNRNY